MSKKILHKIVLASAAIALTSLVQAQPSAASGSTMPGTAAPAPANSVSGASEAATGNPANSAANDPFVQRREARRQARAEYKAKKKAAKQQYKTEKKEADANLKASGATAAGVQRMEGAETPSSGK